MNEGRERPVKGEGVGQLSWSLFCPSLRGTRTIQSRETEAEPMVQAQAQMWRQMFTTVPWASGHTGAVSLPTECERGGEGAGWSEGRQARGLLSNRRPLESERVNLK